jgi:RNA polymerase sigma-70 factor (ECF subfamily)
MTVEQDVLVRLLLAQRAMLLGYIGSIVRDAHLAEDVFQDATLVALKKRDELGDVAGFAPWARRIARLEAMNALRRIQKAPRALDTAVLDVLDCHWDEADEGPASAALRTCLQRLPARSRQVVELRYRDDLSGKDLAEKLAQPVNTVYVTLARIHRALLECMRGQHA